MRGFGDRTTIFSLPRMTHRQLTLPQLARNGFLQSALLSGLVGPQSHEDRRAQLHPTLSVLVSPLRELDFGDEYRLHELNFSQSADLTVERILFCLEWLQARVDFFERVVIKACANLTDVNQPLFLVVQAEHERAEIFAAAFRIGIASD